MAVSEARLNITHEGFPFVFDELSSTALINQGMEQQRTLLSGFDGKEAVQSFGVCQAFFMQNTISTTRGYTSLHYERLHTAIDPEIFTNKIDSIFTLRDADGNVALYSPAGGANYVLDANLLYWKSYPFPGISGAKAITAYLKGVTYICFAGIGLFTYDFKTTSFTPQLLGGITASSLRGCCAAMGMLLVWDGSTVYWSAYDNPLQFTPSIATGAGSTSILATKGEISQVLPIADGFIVYTTENAVAGTYTGDPANPWIFREIPGSAGVGPANAVSYESNMVSHLSWTSGGMQEVGLREAGPAWEELSDSLARRKYSILETGKHFPKNVTASADLEVRMNAVASRYVFISVREKGMAEFPFAYIYDMAVRRWGRIDIPHIDVFNYSAPAFVPITSYADLLDAGTLYSDLDATLYSALGASIAAEAAAFGTNVGIARADGTILCLRSADAMEGKTEYLTDVATPCVLHGKYKTYRSRGIEIQEVHVTRGSSLALYGIVHDLSGDVVSETAAFVQQHANVEGRYLCRIPGDSVSLAIFGKYVITDIMFRMRGGGNRNQPRR